MTLALGVVVGLILGLTGAGGGIIAVPLLIFALNWNVARAAPVALIAVGASAGLGALIGLRQGVVRYRAACLMAVTGAVMTPAGVLVAHQLPPAPLSLLFAALLLHVAWRMFRNALPAAPQSADAMAGRLPPQRMAYPCRLDPATGRLRWTSRCARALAATGLTTGFLSGLLGVGGGFIIVPALLQATDLPMNAIVATSLMVIALVSAFAVLSAAALGHLSFAVALPFAAGALLGMLLGRVLAQRIGGARLQQAFAVTAALVALGLIVKSLHSVHGMAHP